MNAATGFSTYFVTYSAARSSAVPPISPIKRIAVVCGSFWNISKSSIWFVPGIGSPPMPTHVDWPSPRFVSCHTAS